MGIPCYPNAIGKEGYLPVIGETSICGDCFHRLHRQSALSASASGQSRGNK